MPGHHQLRISAAHSKEPELIGRVRCAEITAGCAGYSKSMSEHFVFPALASWPQL
jgi:hypothetical protein